MPGRLRKRHRHDRGVPRELPETSTLPLLEAGAVAAGLPGAFGLQAELQAAGYFDASLMGQWRLAHALLAEHAREAPDPLAAVLRLARDPDPRVRFYAPGLVTRLTSGRPAEALRLLRPLASDADFRVAEAVQAFGVRPQARALGPAAVECLLPWVSDECAEVRRAAVEACRPRGVWVQRLDWAADSPALLLPLLERLRAEPARYVANAVGNTLNDVSKEHPRLAVEVVHRWLEEPPQGPFTRRVAEKALRTLVKQGDPLALAVFGLGELQVTVTATLANGRCVKPNTALDFRLAIRNRGSAARANLVYEIETPGKNPARPRRKRYQGGTLQLPARSTLQVRRRERIFDRRAAPLLPGACRVRFFLNGRPAAEVGFELRR